MGVVTGGRAPRGGVSRWAVAGVVATVAWVAVARVPAALEGWATYVHPALSHALAAVTDRVALPLTPVLAFAGVAVWIALARARPATWGRRATRGLGIALLVVAAFQGVWGLHGARPPVEVRLDLPADPPSDADVAALADALLATLRRDAPVGPFDGPAAEAAVRREVARFAPDVRLPARAKRVPHAVFGPLGVGGVISPWTLEVHVDGGLPAWARAATAAHEWAHAAGFESEAGAELVGALAGVRADHPDARYAAALRAWTLLPPAVRSAALEGVAAPDAPWRARMRADLRALAEATAGPSPLRRAAWTVYAGYLQVRGQGDGVAGYARGVTLLDAARRAGLW